MPAGRRPSTRTAVAPPEPPPTVRIPRGGPRSVSRGLEVLRLIAASPSGLNLTEIATALRLPKTSVLNVLRSLSVDDYILSRGGKYILASRAFSLAAAIGATVSFPSSILPQLRALAEATNETVTLGTYSSDGLSVVFTEVIESKHDLRLAYVRGASSPIHSTSIGQALLAFMPEPLLKDLLGQRKLSEMTKHTITKNELLEKIPQIRATGVAKNVAGLNEGTMGVGAAVFDATGALRCAIATGGPIGRIRPRQKGITSLVRATAEEMSRILGYQGVYPPAWSAAVDKVAPRRTPPKSA